MQIPSEAPLHADQNRSSAVAIRLQERTVLELIGQEAVPEKGNHRPFLAEEAHEVDSDVRNGHGVGLVADSAARDLFAQCSVVIIGRVFGFKWTYLSGGRYTPIVDLVPSTTYPNVLEPVYGTLNSEQYPDYHRLDFLAEFTSPKAWGYWKFYVDVLNVYNQENISGYEYAPNGRKLISPPAGYGRHVPVTKTVRDEFFPSIGFEVLFK